MKTKQNIRKNWLLRHWTSAREDSSPLEETDKWGEPEDCCNHCLETLQVALGVRLGAQTKATSLLKLRTQFVRPVGVKTVSSGQSSRENAAEKHFHLDSEGWSAPTYEKTAQSPGKSHPKGWGTVSEPLHYWPLGREKILYVGGCIVGCLTASWLLPTRCQ